MKGCKIVRKLHINESGNRIKNLFVSDEISRKEAAELVNDSEPFSSKYRIVLNCKSERRKAGEHRKLTVGIGSD